MILRHKSLRFVHSAVRVGEHYLYIVGNLETKEIEMDMMKAWQPRPKSNEDRGTVTKTGKQWDYVYTVRFTGGYSRSKSPRLFL